MSRILIKITDNKIIKDKINLVKNQIVSESKRNLDDQKIVRFLTLIDLCREIKEST